MAYKGVRRLMSQTEPAKVSVSEIPDEVVDAATPPTTLVYKSFIDLGEEEVDAVSMGTGGVALGTIREDDEDFFGEEIEKPPRDIPDAPIARLPPPIPTAEIAKEPPHSKPTPAPRRGRIGLPQVIYDPLFGGYDRGYGGLGLSTHLLRFKYITVPRRVQQTLDSQLLHKRPYFTYWLMVVHIIVMVTALSVYGFAPYGWDQQVDRGTVLGSNLAFDTEERIVIPNVWGGPSQQSLVLLGALYGPCMRRDRQLFEAIDQDRNDERNQSGCCVRLDESGCVQERNRENCPRSRTADFVDFYIDNGSPIRGVCGTSPRTCTDPRPGLNSDLWIENDILTWPICLESNISDASGFDHLTCDITGRPCCVGIQAHCTITTREHCDFLQGRFHQDAFLCSQVDCLNDTCGLLPFAEFNEPDQFYRLWIALFMHAGLFHLILSLIFSFLILRHVEKRLGWLRTSIIYIFSGIGGNLVSVFFVPYNPEVRSHARHMTFSQL
jgi:membrane associated rhomboid family serine protease